ncbi:MAG: carbohydrate binding family 9 domain-containing protein [bacterium]|nr:carbohydrate binding family 9 domain-containing protein [bacterium]
MKVKKILFLVFLFYILAVVLPAAEKRIGEGVTLYPKLIEKPPKLDGVLDDDAWKDGPIVNGPFIINSPVYGETLKQKTEIYIAYDPDNIYFAFYCHDDEPDKIKASISRRDGIMSDDWIDVDIDTMGNRQFTLEHACNPYGIQTDLLNSVTGGETSDPDWIWYSNGKKVKDGYIVEMRIPLKSIRFKSGENVTMHMGFYRNISRSGINASWPQVSEQDGYFNSLVPVVFGKLDKQLRLEALPSVTYGNIKDRESIDNWSSGDGKAEFGLGVKYGITSSISAEVTVNPDFSQVESDQFQVVTNQRFPIFYNEKRPFFMEVRNQFNLAGAGGFSNMSTAVHTRRIVDPAWGGKLTGEVGKFSFGLLAAGDEWAGRDSDGKNANFYIGRFKYSLKGDNYIGLLYSSREYGNEYNRVMGGDFRFRLKGSHSFQMNALYSTSRDGETEETTKGSAFTLSYNRNRKELDIEAVTESYSRDFRMDTSFFYRTGITRAAAFVGPKFYPDKKKTPWLLRVRPTIFVEYVHDRHTGMDDSYVELGVDLRVPMNGNIFVGYENHKESWVGEEFSQGRFKVNGFIQLTNWLRFYTFMDVGKALYYDPEAPFSGDRFNFYASVRFQPSTRIIQDFEYRYQSFKKASDGEKVYDLNILVSKTTYQFNKYLFFRALVQYDSYREVVLTDLLASYTLKPGTVIHLGYGSQHEKRYWDPASQSWTYSEDMGKYYPVTRSLFFKAGYLIRF